MSKIYAIANQKGGVGKTTLTLNLGASLAQQGYKVCLVDCDGQANLTMALGYHQPDELTCAIPDLIQEVISINYKSGQSELLKKREYILHSQTVNVDFIPSNIGLAYIENSLVNTFSRENVLKEILSYVKNDYDYILVDAPPSLGIMVANVLNASDSVLIPVQPQFFSAKGLELLFSTINTIKEKLNPSLSVAGAVVTMYDSRINLHKEVLKIVENIYAGYVNILDTKIPMSIKVAESQTRAMSIFEHEPNSKIAESYRSLTKE